MHARLWYNWWQRTCNVRYIPPNTIELEQVEVETNLAQAVPKSSATTSISEDTKLLLSTTEANSVQTMVSNSNINAHCSSSNMTEEISCSNDNIV